MPSFPDSVFAPANRSNGQTIDASHMNGVQDEIVAIEGGYLNATARLNSSNSTIANLSVTGGSTLAGGLNSSNSTIANLSVTGGSTLAGTLQVTGTSTFTGAVTLPRIPCVRLTHSAVQQIPNGSFLGLDWDTEVFDSTAMHSTATNSSRINLTSSGLWHLGLQVNWLGNATPNRFIKIVLNDSTTAPAALTTPASALDPTVHGVGAIYLATSTTDYMTAQVFCNGSTGRVNANPEPNYNGSFFWAYRVSN